MRRPDNCILNHVLRRSDNCILNHVLRRSDDCIFNHVLRRSDDCIFNPVSGMRGDEEYSVQLSPMQVVIISSIDTFGLILTI